MKEWRPAWPAFTFEGRRSEETPAAMQTPSQQLLAAAYHKNKGQVEKNLSRVSEVLRDFISRLDLGSLEVWQDAPGFPFYVFFPDRRPDDAPSEHPDGNWVDKAEWIRQGIAEYSQMDVTFVAEEKLFMLRPRSEKAPLNLTLQLPLASQESADERPSKWDALGVPEPKVGGTRNCAACNPGQRCAVCQRRQAEPVDTTSGGQESWKRGYVQGSTREGADSSEAEIDILAGAVMVAALNPTESSAAKGGPAVEPVVFEPSPEYERWRCSSSPGTKSDEMCAACLIGSPARCFRIFKAKEHFAKFSGGSPGFPVTGPCGGPTSTEGRCSNCVLPSGSNECENKVYFPGVPGLRSGPVGPAAAAENPAIERPTIADEYAGFQCPAEPRSKMCAACLGEKNDLCLRVSTARKLRLLSPNPAPMNTYPAEGPCGDTSHFPVIRCPKCLDSERTLFKLNPGSCCNRWCFPRFGSD